MLGMPARLLLSCFLRRAENASVHCVSSSCGMMRSCPQTRDETQKLRSIYFSRPEISMCGLTLGQLRDAFGNKLLHPGYETGARRLT